MAAEPRGKLVIFGTGDFARVAAIYFSKDSPYEVVGFTADQPHASIGTLLTLPVIPFEQVCEAFPPQECRMFVAIGFKRLNKARAEVCARVKDSGYELASFISSKAISWGEWSHGEHCFVLEQNVIQPFVQIGNDVVLWSGNHIGHDVVVGDHCFLSSQVVLSGRVRVGAYSFLGVNTSVKQGVSIGEGCLIGAGAIILKDTKPGSVHLVPGTGAASVPAAAVEGML